MDTAAALEDRVQALAAALNDAGVSPERAAAILYFASAATAHALALVEARGLAVVRVEAPAALAA